MFKWSDLVSLSLAAFARWWLWSNDILWIIAWRYVDLMIVNNTFCWVDVSKELHNNQSKNELWFFPQAMHHGAAWQVMDLQMRSLFPEKSTREFILYTTSQSPRGVFAPGATTCCTTSPDNGKKFDLKEIGRQLYTWIIHKLETLLTIWSMEPISVMPFPSQFKFDSNFVLLLFLSWIRYHFTFLHILRWYCCAVVAIECSSINRQIS